MFPCQGGAGGQATAAGATNLVGFRGCRRPHFCDSLQLCVARSCPGIRIRSSAVADWTAAERRPIQAWERSTRVSTTAPSWRTGSNMGATVPGDTNQINISTLRTDVGTVNAPAQSWVTLNSGSYSGQTGNPVMQMTFNAPVGAPACKPVRTCDVQRLPRHRCVRRRRSLS